MKSLPNDISNPDVFNNTNKGYELFGGPEPRIVINDGYAIDTDGDSDGEKSEEHSLMEPLKVHFEEFCIDNND